MISLGRGGLVDQSSCTGVPERLVSGSENRPYASDRAGPGCSIEPNACCMYATLEMGPIRTSPSGTCDYSVINSSILLVDLIKRRLTLQDPSIRIDKRWTLAMENHRVVHIPREYNPRILRAGRVLPIQVVENGQLRTGDKWKDRYTIGT
jgi:hypothetical protein